MEHVVENKISENPQNLKEKKIILSKEDRERKILAKFKDSMTKSLENLQIKNKDDQYLNFKTPSSENCQGFFYLKIIDSSKHS